MNETKTLLQVALDSGAIVVGRYGLLEGRYLGKLPNDETIILGAIGDEYTLNAWLNSHPTAEDWERKNKSPFAPTESQKILVGTYAGGEYKYLVEAHSSYLWEDLRVETVGDSLFLALWRDLSAREDCADMNVAIQRMETAVRDVQTVLEALRNAQMQSRGN